MKKISQKFSDWIFNSFQVTPEGLGLFRIFAALFILCFLMPSTEMYDFIGSLPDDFYAPPPGPMWLFDGFPGEEFFMALHLTLIVLLVLLLVGYKSQWVSILVGVVLLIIKGFVYSVGKINHDLLLPLTPIVMAFSGWGAAYSVDALRFNRQDQHPRVASWPLTLLTLFIGFMMFTAGFAKLLGGWLQIDSQATVGHVFNQYYGKGRQDLLAGVMLQIESPVFWEILDYITLIFEIGFVIAIFHSKTTKLFVSFAVLFHFSVMVMMNISFVHNFVAYAAFLNWTMIDNTFKEWLPMKLASPAVLTGSFAIIGLVILLAQNYSIPNLESDLEVHEFIILLTALPIAVTYIGRQFQQIVYLRAAKGSNFFKLWQS